MSNEPSALAGGITTLVVLVLVVALIGGVAGMERVAEGTVAVETRNHAATGEILEPGFNWLPPLYYGAETIPTRPQVYTMDADPEEGAVERQDAVEIITSDGQTMHMDVTVRYRIEAENAVTFYREYRTIDQAQERLMRPTTRSVMRDEASDMSARQAITRDGRIALTEEVENALHQNFEGTGLTLEAVQIRDVHLDEDFQRSLERVEIQEAESERVVIEAQADAQAEIERAEGQAEAYEIRGEALRENPEVLDERMIEALERGETIYVPTGDNALPMFIDPTPDDETGSIIDTDGIDTEIEDEEDDD